MCRHFVHKVRTRKYNTVCKCVCVWVCVCRVLLTDVVRHFHTHTHTCLSKQSRGRDKAPATTKKKTRTSETVQSRYLVEKWISSTTVPSIPLKNQDWMNFIYLLCIRSNGVRRREREQSGEVRWAKKNKKKPKTQQQPEWEILHCKFEQLMGKIWKLQTWSLRTPSALHRFSTVVISLLCVDGLDSSAWVNRRRWSVTKKMTNCVFLLSLHLSLWKLLNTDV